MTAHKPDPEPVLEGARLSGFGTSRCVYVGDSPHDVAAAKAAGAASIAVSWGVFSEAVLAAGEPDLIVGSVGELLAALPERSPGGALG